jgi:hypothetical protein
MILFHHPGLLSRAATNDQNVWFIVRYSNGAVGPDEVSSWPLSKFYAAVKHLGFWLDRESTNASAT